MNFNQAVYNYNNNLVERTENGMKALKTSSSKVLDLFGRAGSARGVNLSTLFHQAFSENEDLTTRLLLWLRDIRGGAGERQQFRDLLQELEEVNPSLALKILPKIPELGRWDDLFAYKNKDNRRQAFDYIWSALMSGNALCAKWMPRKGPVAVELTRHFNLSPRQYRKLLVRLTQAVETQMCAQEWNKINFSHVPSVASSRYQKAFMRNAEQRYSQYIQDLKSGNSNTKINASSIFPHDVVRSIYNGNAQVADEQWKALPNYVGSASILPVVDVSGSMGSFDYKTGKVQPIEVAVALGLYLSEKNQSTFKDLFITFSNTPEAVQVRGTLQQRLHQMVKSDWGMSTDLHRVFDLILEVAQKGRVSQESMPETVLILSDMQFNSCVAYDHRAIEMIEYKYLSAGYKVPQVVFWNLNGEYTNTPVKTSDTGVSLISGYSPSIIKAILSNSLEQFSPLNVMMETLKNERYDY